MAIGNEPVVEPLILTRGADLVHNFDLNDTDPDIPDGATARIEITEDQETDSPIIETWTTLTREARKFVCRVESEDSGDNEAIENGFRYRLIVSLPDSPTLEHCWRRGPITRQQ